MPIRRIFTLRSVACRGESNRLTRQKEAFLTLMENFPDALNYAALAMDSAGTAEQKFGAYLDSAEAAVNKMKAAWESFSKNFAQSDTIIGAINALTTTIKVLDSWFGKWLLNSIAAMATLKLLHVTLAKLFTTFTVGKLATSNLSLGFTALRVAGLKATSQNYLVTASLASEASAAEVATAATAAFNLVLGAASVGIGLLITGFSAYNQHQEEVIQKAKEHIETVDQESKSLESLIQQYKDLASSENYDDTTRESIKNIQEQINELVGDEKSGLDLVNGNLDEQLEKLRQIKRDRAETELPDTQESKEVLVKNLQESVRKGDYSAFGIARNMTNQIINETGETFQASTEALSRLDKVRERTFSKYRLSLEEIRKNYEELIDIRKNLSKEIANLEGKIGNEDKINTLKSERNAVSELLKNYNGLEKAESAVGKYAKQQATIDVYDSIQAIGKAASMTEEQIKKLPKAQQNAIKAVKDGAVDTKQEFEALKTVLTEGKTDLEKSAIIAVLLEYFPEFKEETESAESKVRQLGDSIENLKSVYDTLTSAIDEYNSQGAFSLDTIDKLVKLSPEYLNYLFDENGQIRDQTSALQDLMQAQIQEQAQEAALAFADQYAGKSSEYVIKALMNEAAAAEETASSFLKLAQAKVAGLGLNSEASQMLLNKMVGAYNEIRKANYKSSKASKSSSKADDKYGKAISYVTKTIENRIKALEKEKEAIEEVKKAQEEELEQYDKALSYINKYVSARIKELEDERDALKEKNDEANREIELEELRNNLQKAHQRTMRVYYAGQGKI